MEGLNVFDSNVMYFVQSYLHSAITDRIFIVFSLLGEFEILWFGIILFCLIKSKHRRLGAMIFIALVCAWLLSDLILKNIALRDRPFVAYPDFTQLMIEPPGSYSFPSSHSATSSASATVILLYNRKAGIFAYSAAGSIAFSRVLLFVHYPSDVLAGMLLGVLMGVVVTKTAAWFLRKRGSEKVSGG